MNVTSPAEIRNVAFIGHGGSGKTALAETFLHLTGATARQGKVDEGMSLLDSDPEEQKRKISINLALAAVPHEHNKINIIDTPGYADFQGDVKAALRVVDGAIVVVEGAAGLQVGTQTAWDYAEERSLPRLVFISRLDRERTNFRQVLDQLRDHYGSKGVGLEGALGEEHGPQGAVEV